MLMLMVPESEYDEAAVVRMLESIRLPDDASDAESSDEPDMQENSGKGNATPPADEKKLDEKESDGDATSESSP
jgi:hypothetical protein